MKSVDSFQTIKNIHIGTQSFSIYSLRLLEESIGIQLSHLPISLRILLENLLRHEDGRVVRNDDIEGLAHWNAKAAPDSEIAFMPARVLLQDFTGVPCIVDLAVMRDAMIKMGGDPNKINPLQPVDLVIDHSVQVDEYGTPFAFQNNATLEFKRNRERYAFLRWGQQAFKNFRVVPPDTGIVHQVNLEYLAQVVFASQNDGGMLAYPDTLVGTDSHTTMINGLGVLGWGVGGIEAEAAMLGQPISMLIPQVVGFKLHGKLKPGTTATDLVLTVTQILRKKGVVGKFIEFFGSGLSSLSLADRATIANMAPEYGATMGFFPVDVETLNFLRFTGRSDEQVALIEAYLKEQGLFYTEHTPEPEFSDILELDLATIEPSIAGPKRPQDRILLLKSKSSFRASLVEMLESKGTSIDKAAVAQWVYYSDDTNNPNFLKSIPVEIEGSQQKLKHGSVVIAAITSCTNTSNPSVLITAGLLAQKASEKGLKSKPWVKTSFAPGSKAVTEYLRSANLMDPLESLGFHLVGYGCMTCIGNSGPLPEAIGNAIQENDLIAVAVLSGNRNFEGRINPHTQANYLASPPLVIAYALAGTMDIDFAKEPIGTGTDDEPVFLKDIWPSPQEVEQVMHQHVKSEMFKKEYANVFDGEPSWQNLPVPTGAQYAWDESSTYIKPAPYFENLSLDPKPLQDIHNARVLVMLGDSVTTDHISPAGSFNEEAPAGNYLSSLGIDSKDFNQYGTRRGNHEVMMRGTFANIRLKNLLVPGIEGGMTLHPSSQEPLSIFDAAMKYKEEGTPLIVIAGMEYGCGSSRDWAAKGPALLGVRAVIAESFERIHRSNLIGMGILPLQFEEGQSCQSLDLSGFEVFEIEGIAADLKPKKKMNVTAISQDGSKKNITVTCRIDTPNEVDYYKHGGILQYVLRSLLKTPPQVTEHHIHAKTEGSAHKYKILFKGEIDADQELRTVKERMAQLFKASPEQIEKLFTGKSVTLNYNLDHTAAQEFITELKNVGALCYFEPMKAPTVPPPGHAVKSAHHPPAAKPSASKPSRPSPPKSVSKRKIPVSSSPNPQLYTAGWVITAVGMIFLFVAYNVLILFLASTTIDHIIDNTSLLDIKPFILGILIYILPIPIGILLVVSLLKPLFARPVLKRFSIPLARKKDQAIYTFVDKLCHSIGAKAPSSIEVDFSANAIVKYRKGLIGFLEDELTLTVGLPIISETTTAELASLLTHEFGHFTQEMGRRLYYIITSVNSWFTRVSSEQDEIDQKITVWAEASDTLFARLIISIVKFFVWLTRKILTLFMLAGCNISKFYTHQMETDADRHVVRLASTEAFESAKHKLQILPDALKEAFQQLNVQKKPSDSSLPDDFILLVSSIIKKANAEKNAKTKENVTKEGIEGFESEPIEQKEPEKSTLPSVTSSSSLFSNFIDISKTSTMRLYREVLVLQIDKESLIPTDDFINAPPPTETTKTTETFEITETPEIDDNFFK